jgi:hypothetical protein
MRPFFHVLIAASICQSLYGQDLPSKFEKWQNGTLGQLFSQKIDLQSVYQSESQLDSVLRFEGYVGNDSLLRYRSVYLYPNPGAQVQFSYAFSQNPEDSSLLSIDSSQFDALDRLVFSQTRIFPLFDSVSSRTVNYYLGSSNLIDSSIIFNRDLGYLSPASKTDNAYDAQQRLSETTEYRNIGLGWEPTKRTLNIYDIQGRLSKVEKYDFIGTWDLVGKIDVAYPDNLTTISIETVVATNQPVEKVETVLDAVGNNSNVSKIFYWDAASMAWVNFLTLTSEFDANDRLFRYEFAFYNPDATSRFDYFYAPDGDLSKVTIYKSDNTTQGLEIDSKSYYFYSEPVSLLPEPSQTLDVGIWPNPTSGWLYLNVPLGSVVEIFDSKGRAVVHVRSADSQEEINLSQFPKGAYLVKIQQGEKSASKIVVVE